MAWARRFTGGYVRDSKDCARVGWGGDRREDMGWEGGDVGDMYVQGDARG